MGMFDKFKKKDHVGFLKKNINKDMSLSEIAEETGVSRQAVSTMLHAAQRHLAEYEKKLGLLARHRHLTEGLEKCLVLVRTDPAMAERKINELLNEEE